ncbi:MAG: cytochrome P450 [Ktedonobacterales bacterium]
MQKAKTTSASCRPAQRRVPPSAPGGNLILGSAGNMQRGTLQYIQTMAAIGDVVRYRFVAWRTIFLNHPDYIKHVLQENNRNYSKDVISNQLLKAVLGTGLLTNDGESWLLRRRLVQPAFHRQRIAGLCDLMASAATAMLDRWETRPDSRAELDVASEMMGLTLRIVGLALFGTDMSGEVETVGRSFTTILNFMTGAMYQPFVMLPGVPARGKRQFRAACRELDQVVYRIIAERHRSGGERDDLISMLLHARDEETGESMNDRQLHDEIITLLLAGHETTAVALTWTWYLLSMHPSVERRLHDELHTVLAGRTPTANDLPQLTYTRMVIEEAMRLYPPVWSILRRAVADDDIGPYHVPAGTSIFISPYAVHRHTAFWEDPEAFDPERFTPERSGGRPHFAYVPFGGGPRQCIGNTFAMTEAQLILATIAQRYRLRPVNARAVEPNPLITLRPKGGLLVQLERTSVLR